MSRLVLKDKHFCDRLIDVVHPRRPPNVDDALIHEGIRDLGVDRVRLLFVSNNVTQAFSSAKLQYDEVEFWVNAIHKGCMAIVLLKKANIRIYLKHLQPVC